MSEISRDLDLFQALNIFVPNFCLRNCTTSGNIRMPVLVYNITPLVVSVDSH